MQAFAKRTPRSSRLRALATAALLSFGVSLSAQISLSTAVNLALGNDNRVKLAQADLAKAMAVLAQSREVFVPAIAATGGVGKSSGAPLSPPVVFSMAAQSLVYSSSQADYIRAARAGVEAAHLALDAARSDVAEDVVTTYVTLDNARERAEVQREALGFATRLVQVSDARFAAGVDSHLELTKARRSEVQIRLQQLLVEDEVAAQTSHLAVLTGLPARGLGTVQSAIPEMRAPAPSSISEIGDSSHVTAGSAAFAAARAKQFTAHADKHYLLRPQIAFVANYARISTAFTNYEQYYPRFGANNNSFNSLSVGVQITLPLLDMVHRAKFHEAEADAAHSLYEARIQQVTFLEGRNKLRRSAAELVARRDLANVERDLAQDQLEAVTARLQAVAGSVGNEQLTPKDEANARLGERQRTLDMLNASLQLAQTEVMLMRQEGSLTDWLALALPTAGTPTTQADPVTGSAVTGSANTGSATTGPASPAANPALPPTVGAEPGSPAPVSVTPNASPASVPTIGTPPATLPSSPVTTPIPASPQPASPPEL